MSDARNIVDQYPMEQMVAGTPQTSVYRSTDPASGEVVAVKIISPLGSGSAQVVRQHFLRAMGAVQFLQLPAFPEILDFGFTEDDAAFMVMRWVDGCPIGQLRGEGPARLLPLFLEIIEALEALAMGQVHHLNLSPENLLVTTTNDGESVAILGFGTSIYLTASQGGAMMGHSPESDAYMAPERLDPQTANGADGSLADLYSLSLILAELFGADFNADGSGNRLVSFPEAMRSEAAGLGKLEEILSSALKMDPKQRETSYPLLGKVLRDLIAEYKVASADARTGILSPEEIRAATAEAAGDPETGLETRILLPEEMPQDSLELGGGSFELDLPEGEAPVLPSDEEETVELPVQRGNDFPVAPAPPAVAVPSLPEAEAGHFDIAETTPTPRVEAPRVEETKDLDETDPGVFDPNETNPALDPKKLVAAPSPPEAVGPPPLPPASPAPPPAAAPAAPAPAPAEALPPVHTPAGEVSPSPPPPASTAGGGKKWLIFAAGGALLFLLLVTLVLMRSCRKAPEAQTAVVVEVAPTPTPRPLPEDVGTQMHPILQQAAGLLEAGDLKAAKAMIEELRPEEINAFSEEERQNYESILHAVRGSQLDAAISDLEGGLKHGSIRMLKRSVAAFGRLDSAEYRNRKDVRTKLSRARELLKLHAALWKAHDSGGHRGTLELAGKMIKLLPGYSSSYKFRDEAASALETASETALAQRNFRLASQILAPVEEFYPDRKGLKSRLDAIRATELKYQQQKEKLEAARAKGAAGQPEAGLAILKTLKLDPSLQAQGEELEKSLKVQLVEMDRNPPRISPVEGQDFSYKKKKSIQLKFRITDDLGVRNATILLRFKGSGSFIRKSLEAREGGLYVITISPAMHHNDDFKFYVEARDASDHVGRLGSAQKPMKVKRKKGLKALFGG